MTTQTSKPTDTPSADTRHTTDHAELIVLAILWLGLSLTAGLIAALAAETGRDPTFMLGVLALGWSIAHTSTMARKHQGGDR